MEAWAHDNGRFIGASVQDDPSLLLLPHERPGLVRFGALAAVPLPGGVLIENLSNLDAVATQGSLARAVLGRYLQRGDTSQNPPLWYGEKWRNNRPQARQATAKNIDLWVDQAGRSQVNDELGKYTDTVHQRLPEIARFEEDALDFLIYLGSGPLRDQTLAKDEYRRLRATNSDTNIARYLETYGYINPAGTVGRWYHNQLQALHDNI